MTMIYVDIETIPACRWEDFSPGDMVRMPKSYKVGSSAYRAEFQKRAREAWLGTALDSSRGRIIAVSWATDPDLEPYVLVNPDERALLTSFRDALVFDSVDCLSDWITFAGERFDLPWLRHRAMSHGVPDLAWRIPRRRYQTEDVLNLWAGTNSGGKYKLADIARVLGIPCKLDLPEGKHVAEFMVELTIAGRYNDIAAYAKADVVTTRAIYHRIADNQRSKW